MTSDVFRADGHLIDELTAERDALRRLLDPDEADALRNAFADQETTQ